MSMIEARIKEMPGDDLINIALGLNRQLERMDKGLIPESPRRREVNNSLQNRLVGEWTSRFLKYLGEKYPIFEQIRRGGQIDG